MKLSINDLQAYLLHTYGERGNETGLFMKLVEEIGEVAEVLNCRAGRKSASDADLTDTLARELSDVIHYTVAIAAINGIDLSATIVEKDRQAAVKYGHDVNLATFLWQADTNDRPSQQP